MVMRCYQFLRSTMMALFGGAAVAIGGYTAQWDPHYGYPHAAADDSSEQATYFDYGPVTHVPDYTDEYSRSWSDQSDWRGSQSTWDDSSTGERYRFEYPEEKSIADLPDAEPEYYEEEYYYKYGYEYVTPQNEPAGQGAAAGGDVPGRPASDVCTEQREALGQADDYSCEYEYGGVRDYGYQEESDYGDAAAEYGTWYGRQSDPSDSSDDGTDGLSAHEWADSYDNQWYGEPYTGGLDRMEEDDADNYGFDYGDSYEAEYGYRDDYGYDEEELNVDSWTQPAEIGFAPEATPTDLIEDDPWAPQAEDSTEAYCDPSRWEGEFDIADQQRSSKSSEASSADWANSATDPYFDGYEYDGYDYREFEQDSQDETAWDSDDQYDPYAADYEDPYESDPYDHTDRWDAAEFASEGADASAVSDFSETSAVDASVEDLYEYAWPEESYGYPAGDANDVNYMDEDVNYMDEPASELGDDSQWDQSQYEGYSEAYPEAENAYPADGYDDECYRYNQFGYLRDEAESESYQMDDAEYDNEDEADYWYEGEYDADEAEYGDAEYESDGMFTPDTPAADDASFDATDPDEIDYNDQYHNPGWEDDEEQWWNEPGDPAASEMPSVVEQPEDASPAGAVSEETDASAGEEAWRWWENYYQHSTEKAEPAAGESEEASAPTWFQGECGEPCWKDDSSEAFRYAAPYDPYGALLNDATFDEPAFDASQMEGGSREDISDSDATWRMGGSEGGFAEETAEFGSNDFGVTEGFSRPVPVGVQLFASDPADLLAPDDEQLLRRLDGLWEEPEGVRRAALNDHLESLGWEAVELAGRFEQVTGIDALELANDLPSAAALLAAHRLVERGELTLDEAVEVLHSSLRNLPPSWVQGVRRITRNTLDQVRAAVEQVLGERSVVVPRLTTVRAIAAAACSSMAGVGGEVIDTARKAAEGQWTSLLLQVSLWSSAGQTEPGSGLLQR